MTLRALLLGFLLATTPARAAASTMAIPDSTALAPVSLVRALGRIPLTSSVLLGATSPGPPEGMRPDVHSLLIREPQGEREIPLSLVQGLWVRGRATRHGARRSVASWFAENQIGGEATRPD